MQSPTKGLTRGGAARRLIMADLKLLRLSATLLVAGALVSIVVGLLHPDRQPANNHVATFAEYASSNIWTAVHLGQFVGIAIVIAGLGMLFYALDVRSGIAGWANRFGAVSAGIALALYGVLQAVDG